MIEEDSMLSYDMLSKKTDKNRTTIMRNIKQLKEKNYLKRIGSDKSGYWEIIVSKSVEKTNSL